MKILNIEQGGENGDLWHEERHGSVGGTRFESAIGACYSSTTKLLGMGGFYWQMDGDKLVKVKEQTEKQANTGKQKQITLLEEIVAERQSHLEIDDFTTASMERGNELEPLSVEAASKKHNVKIEKCGMLISDSLPWFKFSPDGIVKQNDIVIGGYETKSKAGKKHIEYQLKNEVPPEHLMQCLCPMVMDDCVKWWIFGHFDDRNHINNLFTKGIKRGDYEEFIQVARGVLVEFFEEVNKTVELLGGEYNE